MDKRYQVFVSSTYADLKEERQRVIQALMEMDCIPAGMELFPAADQEQMDFIKRVIDDCDYYILIIGGRYGSTTSEGVSYTEQEYEYALSKGLKVIALLHENPAGISVEKSDVDPSLRARLAAFRDKVSKGRLVRTWKSPDQLPGIVALSLQKTIKSFPAVGWVRANQASSQELLAELNEVRKQNASLIQQVNSLNATPAKKVDNIAGLDETITVSGTHHYRDTKSNWTVAAQWSEIFAIIAPYIAHPHNEISVESLLEKALFRKAGKLGSIPSMDNQIFKTIAVQLQALGLVRVQNLNTVKGGMALFWSLTPEGERKMFDLRVVRTAQSGT